MMIVGWLWAFFLLIPFVSAELSCKDLDGKDVDWFVALKIPNLSFDSNYNSRERLLRMGQAFFYADSNNQEFRISEKGINDSQSAIGLTVQQAIDAHKSKNKDSMYIFYNDQPPGTGELGDKAHAKGLMNFNDKQGFWLVHSAPRFNDPESGKYEYPGTAMKYGQAFLCATFLSDQLDEIGKQIFVADLGIYQKNLPLSLAKKYPRLYHVIEMGQAIDLDQCPYSRDAALKTKGGQWMTLYEKHKKARNDLYANQVAEDKKQSMFVETWLNGDNKADWKNKCGDIFVKNIRAIMHKKDNVGWKSENDHSKWLVTDKAGSVCIGDINRQQSQQNRGGGTLCLENEKIWKFFRDSVSVVECCPGEKSCEAMPSDSADVPEKTSQPGDKPKWTPKNSNGQNNNAPNNQQNNNKKPNNQQNNNRRPNNQQNNKKPSNQQNSNRRPNNQQKDKKPKTPSKTRNQKA